MLKTNDDLPARIKACEARPGLPNCAGAKYLRGRKPERCFAEAKPPLGGAAFIVFYVQFGCYICYDVNLI